MRLMYERNSASRRASINEKKPKTSIICTFRITPFWTQFSIFSRSFTTQIKAYCETNITYFMGLSHIFPCKARKRKKRAPQNQAPAKLTLGPPIWPCMSIYGLGHEKYNFFSHFSGFLSDFWHINGCFHPRTSLTYSRNRSDHLSYVLL